MTPIDPVRVVLLVSSVKNPFVEAWLSTLEAASDSVVVLVDSPHGNLFDFPPHLHDRVVTVTPKTRGGPEWRVACESLLGGTPTAVFHWWGLQSLLGDLAKSAWPEARTVVCIDTFPNASRPVTEAREWVRSLGPVRRIEALVTTSPEMGVALVRRFSALRGVPEFPVLSPFPQRAHASQRVDPAPAARPRLCFTGRSDYLFSGARNMAKDDLGMWLTALVDAGADVFVQRPESDTIRRRLVDAGLDFYPEVPRGGLMNGDFATLLQSFDGQLVYYEVNNPTIRRRVEVGLSTRFATGLCSPSPMIVPPEARFARHFLAEYPVGFAARDPDEIVGRLREGTRALRDTWWDAHHAWAGEAFVPSVRAALTRSARPGT